MSKRFGLASDRVLVHHAPTPAMVVVEDGLIADVVTRDDSVDHEVVDLDGLVLMPALIDTHVHVNDPGGERWEGFATATAAAAAGGVAVLVDMPLYSVPPTVTVGGVARKKAATRGVISVDVGLWGGIVPGNLVEVPLLADVGVLGFMASLADTRMDDFAPIALRDVTAALLTAETAKRPLLVRCGADPEDQHQAVGAAIDAVGRTGGWVHLIGLTDPDALGLLGAAQATGVMITTETSPLTLDDQDTWDCLTNGTIEMIVGGEPPSSDGEDALAGLELRLPLAWTAAQERGIGLGALAGWLCRAPAALAGLASGSIREGMRADLVAWDPDAEFVVDPARLHHRHQNPLVGKRLSGVVHCTWVAGKPVFSKGDLIGPPAGRMLERM